MITLLRRIRRALLSDNKVKTYMLYAIGEIVLVILGILIALAINDWRNEIQDAKNEQMIIESLYSEFFNTKTQIEEFVQKNESIIETNKRFLALCAIDDFEDAEFDSLFYHSAWNQGLILNQGVFKELLSTGKLSEISNRDLRVLLSSWDGILEEVKKVDNMSMDYLHEKIMTYLDKQISWTILSRFDETDAQIPNYINRNLNRNEISKDLELENFIANQIWYTHNKVRWANDLLTLNYEILEKIEPGRQGK